MKVNKKDYSTIWLEKNKVKIIDQTKLPFKFVIKELSSLKSFFNAIKKMEVRGAPLIGVTAAFGLALEVLRNPNKSNILKSYRTLCNSRPTAVNLKWALDEIMKVILKMQPEQRGIESMKIANKIRNDDINSCKQIGKYGLEVIEKIYKKKKKCVNILTHCNAGWLATVDWGTALAPIFYAKKKKIPVHIWVDETRPRNQGALLTSWELKNENISHTVIVDNAGGHLMQNKKIDMCLVGSDRTTISGNVCNKIGTYLKAVVAYENNIPFFVALPTSTIDKKIKKISDIPIELRDGDELSKVNLKIKNKFMSMNVYAKDTPTLNPAFDVTPKKFITKLITEKGICDPKEELIKKLLGN
ncbi:MAG: S-methyl-5-thioribose-1-phosphate isomerase [Alphaproteobacteria bacterium]|nr:S-methyl-5-thioribose-1-phosphate isomerase [Alphaproteobacteria bacterium]